MLSPHELYAACKAIDGDARAGTYTLAAQRVLNRHSVHDRQVFYESLANFDDIIGASWPNLRLAVGTHFWAMNHIIVTVRVFASAYRAFKGRLTVPKLDD